MSEKLLTVYQSGDSIPTLIVVCESVTEVEAELLVKMADAAASFLVSYSFYEVREVTEELVSSIRSFLKTLP